MSGYYTYRIRRYNGTDFDYFHVESRSDIVYRFHDGVPGETVETSLLKLESNKIDKISSPTENNIPILTASGMLVDSGKSIDTVGGVKVVVSDTQPEDQATGDYWNEPITAT